MSEDRSSDVAGATAPTAAQRWALRAHDLLESRSDDLFVGMLSDDFVQESRRAAGVRLDRRHLLDNVKAMREFDMHISGTAVAVAGEYCVLTRRRYGRSSGATELLAVSVWGADGKLRRVIEFGSDDLDPALATLGEVSGEPVIVLTAD